ncbi:transcriptional regulator, putative [Paecilomyces variotii No. 5]|uniref:Transcriptional regulator, putative n=1 Tax=Byssochlamys spectabilis (strain No. 5 / NBRC 109023) TaxID=1356009 RepID=V5FN61_BYSSN|nr:transcriptional regulator, putative [Paecilomyces variotii No. 5]
MPPKYAMSDSEQSESEKSTPEIPSDEKLERGLRNTVADIFKKGNLDELTVKRVRLATEKALGLEEGFFKGDVRWKTKSDEIIKDEVEVQENKQEEKKEEADEEETSPIPPEKAQAPAKKAKDVKRGKSEDTSKPRKRRKTSTPLESEEPSASSDEEGEPVKQPGKKVVKKTTNKKQPDATKDDMSDESDSAPKPQDDQSPESAEKEASESEMSVVLDEEPLPKKRQRSAKAESTGKKGRKPAASKKKDADLDPDQAEIKRLQGWLLKCGIRKMWFRELAPYDTPKAKIKHLKDMLKEAGMEGRYSLEKAKQIREERELKADLEMVQEGAKRWGTGSAGEESDESQPKRQAPRGRKALAFLSDDGEETD